MGRIAVFPGSFDPVTYGHMDLIARSVKLFDRVVVGVLVNAEKTSLFSVDERVQMLCLLTEEFKSVSVKSFSGLLVDFVRQEQADAVVRGLRDTQDLAFEFPLAQANHQLNEHAETIFLATAPEYSFISSSGVKEICRFGGNVSGMVPDLVRERLNHRFSKKAGLK